MITRIKNAIRYIRDRQQLSSGTKLFDSLDIDKLPKLSHEEIHGWLLNSEVTEVWEKEAARLKELRIPEASGGVNQGDQRAIFSLIHGACAKSVLEVGTHIGASTVNLASALASGNAGSPFSLTTVDLIDVNDPSLKHWNKYSSLSSPLENIRTLQLEENLKFVVSDSVEYMSECADRFDFIFLDGDHSAQTVYREVPLALKLLNEGGVILLHDYFPDNKPLWRNGAIISGPYLALERLKLEYGIKVLPLGALPWPTKLDSNKSSLAVVTR